MIVRLRADAARIPLADSRVHCAVTSPPYYGLRKYDGVPEVAWGGGWRGCLGNEPTVDLYVAHIVECFREVRRVLRDDGTCWIVLGDSYGSQDGQLLGVPWRVAFALQADGWLLRSDIVWAKTSAMPESISGTSWQRHRIKIASASRKRDGESGQAPHGAGIGDRREAWRDGSTPDRPQQGHGIGPAGHEFAATATWADCPGCAKCAPNDGLVLRRGSWRPTRAHEFVFLLAKGPGYFCDAEAVREPNTNGTQARAMSSPLQPIGADGTKVSVVRGDDANGDTGNTRGLSGRNPRDVWTLGPEPLREAHYAAFPSEIPRRAILAGTSARGVCATCGAPWARMVERRSNIDKAERIAAIECAADRGLDRAHASGVHAYAPSTRTLGWRATCAHEGDPVPALVLDPFAGSGTTGAVAVALGRRAVLCDLSQSYLRDIADARTRNVQLPLDATMVSP